MSPVASKVLSDVPQSWIIYEWPKYFWQNGFESKLFKLEGTLTLSSWPGIYAEIFFFSLHILIFSTVAYVRWYFSHFSKRILCIFHCLSPKNPSRHLFPQHFFQDSKDASASIDTQPGGFVETTLVCSVSPAGVRLLKCGGALWGCEAERQLWIFLSNESPPPPPHPHPDKTVSWGGLFAEAVSWRRYSEGYSHPLPSLLRWNDVEFFWNPPLSKPFRLFSEVLRSTPCLLSHSKSGGHFRWTALSFFVFKEIGNKRSL